jgi:hypothetical protein
VIYDVKTASGFTNAVDALSYGAGPTILGAVCGVVKVASTSTQTGSAPKVIGTIHNLQGDNVSRSDASKIRSQLKSIAPRTKTQQQVEELAGRPMTKGQIARAIGIGAIVGGGFGIVNRSVGKLGRGLLKSKQEAIKNSLEVINPRQILADMTTGAGVGTLPIWRRKADIEAAKRGKY